MDPSHGAAPQDTTLHRTLQGGPRETADTVNASEDPETNQVAEREPLLECHSVSETINAGGRSNGHLSRSADDRRIALRVQFSAGAGAACGVAERDSLSSSSSSSSSDESVCVAEARPPDGGWGWVVVFAAFMVNLIADGITFSFGVFYVHFLEYFGESKAKTAWIGGIFMAMPLLSGPVASFLTDRYGCRRMTVLGSLLAALGFVVSAFVDDMETLFVTFGIMAGFGLSLCYVAAVVIVAYYFEKKRSLATGISVCGSGIGTFLFAPLTRVLLDEYGWRGTTLIMAGAFLNMCVCGLLMRDLPWTTTMIAAKARDRKLSRERRRGRRAGSSVDSFSDSKSSTAVTVPDPPPAPPHFSSLVDLPTFVTHDGCGDVPFEALELVSQRRAVYAALLAHYPALMLPSRSFSDNGRLHETSGPMSPRTHVPAHHAPRPPASRRAPAAFLRDLRVHRRSLTYRGAMLNINRYRLRASSCPNIYRNSMTTIAAEKVVWYAGAWELWDLSVDVLDLSHLADVKFALFAFSNFLLYTWYDVPYVYIADMVQEMGYSEQHASLLISVIGIVNMLGEIILGWAGDWEFANAGVIYAVCMLFCGAVTSLFPALRSYGALAAASGAFGFFISANYSLTSNILVELITLEKFTNAYGLLLLLQGIANLIGPPLAGWVYDVTASYDLSFYMTGAFIAASGLIMLILPTARALGGWRRGRSRTPSPSQHALESATTPDDVIHNGKP